MARAELGRALAVSPRLEFAVLMALAWIALVGFALSGGGMRLSWDALNHHIYLGWVAEHPRFDLDFLAAGYQSLQFPYLYWPVYRLAVAGVNAQVAAVVLASLHAACAVPPVWLIARRCIPGAGAAEIAMRSLAVILAFLSGVVLSLFDSSSNDLLAASPLVWAIALGLHAADPSAAPAQATRRVLVSGVMGGMSVAFKFSNGPLAILLPLLWVFSADWALPRARNVLAGGFALLASFFVTYGYWGWVLWQRFGNPMYPFADNLFVPVRAWLGWTP